MDPNETIDLQGEEGEALFWHLKKWLMEEHAGEVQARLDDMWQYYKSVRDERLLALVGALCVEKSLDILLDSFMDDYEPLLEDDDITFSIKTKIARAIRLIPGKILNSCDLIRKVRNDFAHNLELSHFNDLGRSRIDKFEPYVRQFNIKDRDWSDLFSLYLDLVSFTILGLLAYSYQLAALKSYLGTDDFNKHFHDHVARNELQQSAPGCC